MAIYYLNFSDNQVFNSPLLNTSLNQIYTFLINNLDESILFEMMLDGVVAKKLQNIPTFNDVYEVEVLVTSKRIFDFLKASYSSLNISQLLISETNISFVINGFKFLFNYNNTPVVSQVVQGVFVRKYV